MVATALAGCGGETPEEAIAQYAQLAGAKESAHEALRLEVLRIEEAGQTPRQLVHSSVPNDDNAASLLSRSLSDQRRQRLATKLLDLSPIERYQFSGPRLIQLREAIFGMSWLKSQLERAEAAPECEFEVHYDLGFFSKMRFLDDAAIACRYHALAAAPRLAEGDVTAAIDQLDAAMRWVDRLSRVDRIEARLQAAHLRGLCLAAIETIVTDDGRQPDSLLPLGKSAQQADIERLYAVVRRSLANWPDDAGPLIGDRAVALHSYEALRDGQFDRLVTFEEQKLLDRRGELDPMRSMSAEAIDRDELAYLQAMAGLIAAASTRYDQRAEQIEAALGPFADDGAAARDAPLASQLFLPGLRLAMREIARDRAICEAWAIALAAAGELVMPPYQTNPVNGEEYAIDRLSGLLIVRLGDDELREPTARPLSATRGQRR